MDFDLPPADHPARAKVREWIAANPSPSGKDMAEAGYVVPHWPAPWGLDASPIELLVATDSIETQPVELSPKIEIVSVAPLFGEAIRRIHARESISVLFPD